MVGYIGERARRKKRNFVIIIIILLIMLLSIYIIPSLKLTETLPSDTLLPSDDEIISPKLNSTIEELELEIFDKDQKIIFRNNQIMNLKNEIKILIKENKKFSESIVELNNKVNSSKKINDEVNINVNQEMQKLVKDNKKSLLNLKSTISVINNEKKSLLTKLEKSNQNYNELKKEYKKISNKNLKLNNINDDFEKSIKNLNNIIEEQNLLIKVLQDTSHHN